jgi:hypothetical protein
MKKGKAGEETNRYLDVHAIKSESFLNWDAYLDRFYKKRVPGISKYHYFGFSDEPLQLKTTVSVTDVNQFQLCKLGKRATEQQKEAWVTELRTSFPDVEPVPGLAEIKQCELYLKWISFVPDEFKDEICPIKSDKKAKLKIKKEAMAKVNNTEKEGMSI